jgi:uncharacterized protein with NRDE domain
MCLIFLALDYHPRYKLVIAGNRDEFYNRKTAAASFWEDHPNILAGRDLEAMGTWLGVTTQGRISMLTNYRDVKNLKASAPSRGKLVSDFLSSKAPPEQYVRSVSETGDQYNGFNLLTGTIEELWYYSNYGPAPRKLAPGLYGLSNHLLDAPWPKVVRGKEKLKKYLTADDLDPEVLFQLLYDEDRAPDQLLPDTGLDIDRERALSSMFIKTTGYGSRCTTVILVDKQHKIFFTERVFDTETFQFSTSTYEFAMVP